MKFLSVANTHASYRSFCAKGTSVRWVSHDIVSLIKEHDKMHKRAISENDHILFRQYRSLRNMVTNKICSKKEELMTLYLALILPKIYGRLCNLQQEKPYTLIMYPLIL